MACMGCMYVAWLCQGMFVVAFVVLVFLLSTGRIHNGGPCLRPSLEKGGPRPVSPLHYYLPFSYRDHPPMGDGHVPVSRLKRLDRTWGTGGTPLHRSLGYHFFSRPPIGYLYSIAVQRFLSKRWQRFKKLPVPRYRVDQCRRCGNLFHKHKQSRGELHEFNRSGHPAKPTLIQLFRVCCQHDHRACIALCS
jgi:hypothetical protein